MSLNDTLSRLRALDRLAPEVLEPIRLLELARDRGLLARDPELLRDVNASLDRAHAAIDLYLDDLENRK